MIQWCDDCTHSYYDLAEVTEERYEFCMKCMTESKPGQMPTRYEQKVSARKGRWIKHDTGHSVYYDCSLCGCLAPSTETEDEFIWKLSNYCPDCGADMREGGKNEPIMD